MIQSILDLLRFGGVLMNDSVRYDVSTYGKVKLLYLAQPGDLTINLEDWDLTINLEDWDLTINLEDWDLTINLED